MRNTKLRPFNSNVTFYGIKKEERNKYISSSLTFYKKEGFHGKKDKADPEPNNSFRFIQSS